MVVVVVVATRHKAAAWREVLLQGRKKSPNTLTPRPVLVPSRCAMVSLVRSVVECLGQVLQESNDKVVRGELGEEELTPTSANWPKRDTCIT